MQTRNPFILAVMLMLLALPVWSSTLEQMSFEEVLETAEFIFEGRVVSVEGRQTGPRAIHTFVTYEVLDVLKGDASLEELELSFLGGTANGRQMVVTELQLPQVGESGFYFVESLHEPMVNPLTGWSQGHFLIEQNSRGQAEVRTAGRDPVYELQASPPQASQQILGHEGAARGVQIQALTEARRPMSPVSFKARVQDLLQQQTRQEQISP